MAIDVFSENVLSFREAAKLLPKKPGTKGMNISTLHRWALRGLRSKDGEQVRLETVKVGGTTCTSKEALQRFFDRLSADEIIVPPPVVTSRSRQRECEKAEEYLRKEGVLN